MNRLRLLILETDPDVRKSLVSAAGEAGHHTTEVSTYLEAVEVGKRQPFDIHLIDLDLSETDEGIVAVQKLRAAHPVSVTMVSTGRPDQDIAVRALECGARCFISKPVDEEDVRLKLHKAYRELRRAANVQTLLGDLIHDRRDLRHKVVERERLLSHLLDAAPFGIVSIGQDGNVLTANRTAEEMYGVRSDDLVGKPPPFRAPVPEDGTPVTVREEHAGADGRTMQVLVHGRRVLNDLNRPVADLYVLEDLTEKAHMENQLLHAERLSLLGQMAPRIAHELKTPLQVVTGSAELAMMAFQSDDAKMQEAWLKKIPEGARQIRDLITQMMNLGKPNQPERRDIRIQDELPSLIESLEPIGLMKYCEVEVSIDPDTPSFAGNPAEVGQVFRNLIVNAVHAMENTSGGRLRITGGAPSGDRVIVRVEDTGVGIEEEALGRIFEPFYTTKPDGKGTGLGLPIVKTIVDRHHGSIQVSSTRGAGATFTVEFPID